MNPNSTILVGVPQMWAKHSDRSSVCRFPGCVSQLLESRSLLIVPVAHGPQDRFGARGRRWRLKVTLSHGCEFKIARSPSSALLSPFLWEGSPTKIDYRKKWVPVF